MGQSELYFVKFSNGTSIVEYGTSIEDIRDFCNRSYKDRGSIDLIAIYDESVHGQPTY
jgi:hypothetical protein